eukprot:CAMPEP_0194371134 /NCGR_PEP_ID=MMETSP0174-20130528/19507_1 /TAXON_ID=216777 /ORGANISM="Proboscia alata, Strain PI-D3" /LENGTH=256 /DNA_ID=CAMNT_0039149005 /DNA_START=21 /DNA_END=791 /DNA_ORIENTATION=+
MFKICIIAFGLLSCVGAFTPTPTTRYATINALRSSPDDNVEEPEIPAAPVVEPINGWVPDSSLPCYGLPGAIMPTGFFDPVGFTRSGITLDDVKKYREAEVQHGRVAMLATVGYLAGEAVSGPFSINGPANDQLQQVPLPAFIILTLFIAGVELYRATVGWIEPAGGPGSKTLWTLRETYYPGDIGFDPLGLKPKDAKGFATRQTKELQNGRLAMLGWAGMCAQELVNHKSIFETLDFYQKVYSGVNPYESIIDSM